MADGTWMVDTYPMCELCVGFQLTPENVDEHTRTHAEQLARKVACNG